MVKVGLVQFDPQLANIDRNLAAIESQIAAAANRGVDLVVFPECATSGYVYHSKDAAISVAETIPGPTAVRLVEASQKHGIYVVTGMLEREGNQLFNTALLVGPDGLLATYRKTHVLCLGVDRFTTPGEGPYMVHRLPFGTIGILICYDLRFPEAARSLALQGAQMVVLPTNWPLASAIQADVFTRVRAAENVVFVLACNRIGEEGGARFLGRSQIVHPSGRVLAEAGAHDPQTLVLEIDPGEADNKHIVVRPGEHEMDFFADRRPDLYRTVLLDSTQSHAH